MIDLLIGTAHAAETVAATTTVAEAAPQGSGFLEIGMVVVFVLIFYLLIWRPQAKRAKEHRDLVSSLSAGDEIITTGGLAGKIVAVKDNFLVVAVGDKVKVNCQKQAVTAVLPKGTLKSLEEETGATS